jgi:hypothetical protein
MQTDDNAQDSQEGETTQETSTAFRPKRPKGATVLYRLHFVMCFIAVVCQSRFPF